MKLLQLVAGQIRLNEPLPWNVRTAPGDLLLGKGQLVHSERQLESLLDRGVYVDQDEYERHRQALLESQRDDNPFNAWADILRRASALLREAAANPQFHSHVDQLAQRMHAMIEKDADVGGFELSHLERVGYPVLHSMQSAYLVTLVAQRLGLSHDERRSALQAALTMNLSMLDLQAVLCEQTTAPTPTQRTLINTHPLRSRALLERLGVQDPVWLQAVEQHHEQTDGNGYPQRIRDPQIVAQILQHCDIYLAKLAARRSRAALPAHQAARDFFLKQHGASNPIAAAVIKETGIYPPGSYVKLANGDTAVVVRRGESANTPQVYSLANGEGIAFSEPLPRDTRKDRFKVLTPVAATNVMVRFDRARLFGVRA